MPACLSSHRQRGFTLVELIVILILVGILAATAIPRLNVRDFDEAGFRDGVKAALQHARKTAVASRRYVCATVSSTAVTIHRDNTAPESVTTVDCTTTPLNLPSSPKGCAANAVCTSASGVSVSLAGGSSPIIFDSRGRPVSSTGVALAGNLTLTIATGVTITVRAESGAVQ